MKIYPNAHNILAVAVVTALNPVASESMYLDPEFVKTGGGIVRPTGAYTGQTDAEFDIEVLNDTIVGTPRISDPVFSGVGNAVMSAVSATGGTAAQSITVTLADLGTDTREAYTPFQGAKLQAKTAGADANYIQITISEAGLTRTNTEYSLLSDLQATQNEYVGREWDFGGKPRNPDGTIPADCPRISFADDPQVYRQFKVFSNGAYVYSFTPAPVRSVAAGGRVKAVTGSRTVTVAHTLGAAAPAFVAAAVYTLGQRVIPTTPNGHWYEVTDAGTAGTEPTWSTTGGTVTTGGVDFIDRGVHTNTYSSIVTLFDALTAIQGDADSLIEVVGPVVNDLTFDGMGITDLSERTGAFVQGILRDGAPNIRNAELSVAVDPGAPTEELTIRCTMAGTPNAEVFEVRGSVSGLLADAVTGVPYDGANYDFTIPLNTLPTIAPSTDWSTKLESSADPKPVPCVEAFFLGALAQPRTFTFEYQLRTSTCNCDGVDTTGGPDPIFLGVDPETIAVESLPANIKTRTETLTEWRADFIEAKTAVTASVSATDSFGIDRSAIEDGQTDFYELRRRYSATITADRIDILASNQIYNLFLGVLVAIDEHSPTTFPSAAGTLWDTFFTDMETDFDLLAAENFGSDFWISAANYLDTIGTGGSLTNSHDVNKKMFTESFDMLIERYKAQMARVYAAADIMPPFDGPTGTGTGPWVDYEEAGWLVAVDSNLQPIQPGHGYHSAIKVTAADGSVTYESTQQFFIAVNFGCELQAGDKFYITIGETGTSVRGYQMGDNIRVQVVAGSAIQLGGGQAGDDTQVWSVVGSVDGALDDYDLLKSSPPTYSDGGISFVITPGGIDSRLGDAFVFWVEGGQFQWRKNGGSWSAATQIAATVALSDGVSVAFDAGTAPSFVDGDAYTLVAEAVNGGSHIPSLTYGGITTTEFVESTITKHRIQGVVTTGESASECMIWFQAQTEVGATVTVRGYTNSGDAEGTEVVTGTGTTNGSRGLLITLSPTTTTCKKFTITYYSTANTPDTIGWQWVFVGHPHEMELQNGERELGAVTQNWRTPKIAGRRADLGISVECTACSSQSVEDLRYALDYAALNDDRRIGVVVRSAAPAATRARDAFGAAHTAYPEFGIMVSDVESIQVTDEFEFQPAAASSLLSVTLGLTPA